MHQKNHPLLLLTVMCLMPAVGYANSAQLPALIIIMQNAPDDATVSLVAEKGAVAGSKSRTAFVWVANLLSLVLGGLLITVLPV